MSKIFKVFFWLVLIPIFVVACGGTTPTPKATPIPPTAIPEPTATLPAPDVLQVPKGNTPSIDGTFSPGEWDDALKTDLTNGGELMLMHDDGYLYMGIRSREMGYGSICNVDDNQISILHSSAGLGTAIFERSGDDWRRIQQFSYCCWEASQSQLDEFLLRDGWVASVGTKGVPEEMEYQIAMEDGLRFAVREGGRTVGAGVVVKVIE